MRTCPFVEFRNNTTTAKPTEVVKGFVPWREPTEVGAVWKDGSAISLLPKSYSRPHLFFVYIDILVVLFFVVLSKGHGPGNVLFGF
jgi:hypothetical protein